MTYILEALEKKPIRLYPLTGTGPYPDYSGYDVSATVTGTPSEHAGLAKGLDTALVFGSATASFASPVFVQGREHQPFSIVAWLRVVSTDGTYDPQQAVGHAGQNDGLVVNGSNLEFTVNFLNESPATISYDMQEPRAIMATGIYEQDKIELYVDDIAIGTYQFTVAQEHDEFAATDGFLTIGETLGTSGLAISGVALYPHVLSGREVAELFRAGRDVIESPAVPVIYRGRQVPLALNDADVFKTQTWATEEHWRTGELNGLTIEYGQLVPQRINDLTTAGEWYTAFALDNADTTSIFGVIADWDGIGATVEASIDGITWEPVTRGTNISVVPSGFDPTGQLLELRVSFPDGMADDEYYLDNLTLTGLRTGIIPEVNGRAITVAQPGAIRFDYPVIEFRDNWGVELNGGSLTIGGNATEPAGTLEAWIKPLSLTNLELGDGLNDITYINGQPAPFANLLPGHWHLIHIVKESASVADWIISGEVVIGTAATYLDVHAGATIDNIYNSYIGYPLVKVEDNADITITELPEGTDIYAHDWSIEGAG